jgi:glycogen(starch) synthase
MKVLMTTDTVGGVWTYAIELCAGLASHGIDVVLATLGPLPSRQQREQARQLQNVTLLGADYRLEWMNDADEDVVRSGEWLMNIAAQHSVDLVHLNGYAHAALAWSVPALVVAHSCVMSWWRAVHGAAAPDAGWDIYRERVTAGLERADLVVAPTHAFLRELQTTYHVNFDSRVIHNARAAERFISDQEHERLPIVFACGRLWDPAKRLDLLDHIAENLPWQVFIAGDPTAPDGSTAHTGAAIRLGPLTADTVATWMQRSSIFVHPACYEPFGLAVLEAALAGCALVLADLPTLRELWEGAAVFVDASEATSLRSAVDDLIHHPLRRVRLARAARVRAARFSPSVMSAAYAKTYRELITGVRNTRSSTLMAVQA